MREIKFRAWDGEVMGAVYELSFDKRGILINCGPRGDDPIGVAKPEGDICLMQYTGLKDKNGTEIYEGDVVLMGHHWDKTWSHKLLVVKWVPSGYIIPFGAGDWAVEGDDVEVIGNIYENPELLGGNT